MPGVARPTSIQSGSTLMYGGAASVHHDGGAASVHGGAALVHGSSTLVYGGSASAQGSSTSTHSGLTLTLSLSQASSIDLHIVVSDQDLSTINAPGLYHLSVCLYVY